MPRLARKLLIIAAVDGLILQPDTNSHQRTPGNNRSSALQIEYKTRRIYSPPTSSSTDDACLESHGVVGLLSLASFSFLISITQREQVAQILGKPIFVITGVAILPLSSQADAARAIKKAQTLISTHKQDDVGALSSGSETDLSIGHSSEDRDAEVPESPEQEILPPLNHDARNGSTIAEDVIKKRGLYGRFASRWFSKNEWPRENRPSQDMGFEGMTDPAAAGSFKGRKSGDNRNDIVELDDLSSNGQKASSAPQEIDTPVTGTATYELMPKFMRYTEMLFSSRNFYFSYDCDITRKFGVQDPQRSPVPLHRIADHMYFWNRNLMTPFIDSGHYSFVLPLIQGFVGQREFTVKKCAKAPDAPDAAVPLEGESKTSRNTPKAARADNEEEENDKFLLTLISRRSVKRPGLRYLRRGVDDEGNVANFVETEQILSRPSWNPWDKVYSLLQVRGSIPLYFSQSPYYFKPIPVLHYSTETNQVSFGRHFHDLSRRYGEIQTVCLLDKNGVEANIGETYERFMDTYNKRDNPDSPRIGFTWFDFHTECRGMKFENVQRLVDSISGTLDRFGTTVIQNHTTLKSQAGIVRTNCMDCLDRTGVTQCAFAQQALEKQLESEGYSIDLRTSTSTQWFNVLWADNGDAISKQYSSTAALKGDYTRTRKRDVRGALNDLGLTLSRYFNNIVNDYFSQSCIDYLLGIVTTRVFDEFEMNLMSTDPGISIEKVRQHAIDTSCQIVISDDSEELVGGWTVSSPNQPNTLRSLPFEQSVILLTNAAVYCCRFDWDTDKVTSFERIDLRSITSINYGTYITSTLTDVQMDPKHNVGVVITYKSGAESILRVNTRSLQSLIQQRSQQSSSAELSADKTLISTSTAAMAAAPARSPTSTPGPDWDISSLFKPGSKHPSSRFMAFKILPQTNLTTRNAVGNVQLEVRDSARAICEEIEHAALRSAFEPGRDASGGPGDIDTRSMVEEVEIISLADAKKRTGYLEHLVFDIKKFVWA
ncbi:uncharacterized protein PADG_06647 [Paracoccidioides brasiliensis Pb18]|uniref:SAC domain-containing protein n=1 Tax=Paracoccidioides brasiliensis (strain Pb18) TaxID=502780 RepID=C1GHB1_PARBD|nr:uncharacterized protein PADG_06647 [Paracoccidioides brasiliensis Pb18]EEH50568.2 hypothetical protein PADG_06647 [Paracoccidioides brasiliensis Pb18]